jgi:hypothetical protein
MLQGLLANSLVLKFDTYRHIDVFLDFLIGHEYGFIGLSVENGVPSTRRRKLG